jgi:aldose 1-epimerase
VNAPNGQVVDVALGFDSADGGYLADTNPYFGASIGRVANRIDGGQFTIDGRPYNVTMNKPGVMLHGGKEVS